MTSHLHSNAMRLNLIYSDFIRKSAIVMQFWMQKVFKHPVVVPTVECVVVVQYSLLLFALGKRPIQIMDCLNPFRNSHSVPRKEGKRDNALAIPVSFHREKEKKVHRPFSPVRDVKLCH